MSSAARCMWMRGGTSKGGYFLGEDLPKDKALRDAFLLRVMGSPDLRQIDGMGGADPLTSKEALISKSSRPNADVDYLFLQISVDQAIVADQQNCGNILAGVGPFALERGLVEPAQGTTRVRIFLKNTRQIAHATVSTPDGSVSYEGNAQIDGVPGTHAPIPLEFFDTAGSLCGALLPTNNRVDEFNDVACTLIDNGMPCVVLLAQDLGITGYESREALDANAALKARLEAIRLSAGEAMRLGDVKEKTVPKMVLVAPPRQGGAITTRSFIPHRAHASVGVFAAVSVATACLLEGTPAAKVAQLNRSQHMTVPVEHPSGTMQCILRLDQSGNVTSAGIVRTARKLMDGVVFA
ncbi:MAG: 4-oxalomesaconate tautomerase [Sphingomonadales bacterium]